MFSKLQLIGITEECLNLYMDWLLQQEISRCESQADNCSPEVMNEVFHRIKQRMLHQELKRHRRALRRVLDEKKRRLHWLCH
ncbi:hypothetical protein ORN12_18460 [Pantoea vagans]|uniref:hypothetical protein n=1 Tax=Pantoea vagans TaxID=470934 RepID=UPI00225B37F4|nr:hypothetical protein [Pantoea vagans]MCX3310954.1 hypothetical protein [Pantoea vagans]